jgi:hypothetical protein
VGDSVNRRRFLALTVGPFLLVCAGVAVLFALDDDRDVGSRHVEASGEYARAYTGLCTARSAARSGEVASAGDAFSDRAHQPLHELAARAAERDRGAAGRLLEAKQAVEADLGRGSPDLAADLDCLLSATASAVAATGGPRPEPCPTGRT